MTELYNTLSAVGYKQNHKPVLKSTTAEFNHPAQIDDQKHLANLHNALATHGYRHIEGGVLPTWVHNDNDDDAISLHSKVKGEGHRLFHMTDNSTNEEVISEGFEITVQHPAGGGHLVRLAAKTNNMARTVVDQLRSKYPSHHIMVRNKHTGLSQIYRPHKEVTENKKMTKTLGQIFESVEPQPEVLNEAWGTLSREAKELVLHADNSRDLHRQSKAPIIQNLQRKMAKGVYDHDNAKKLWAYHADRAAHSAAAASGDNVPWHQKYSTSVRREAAAFWADSHRDSLKDAA